MTVARLAISIDRKLAEEVRRGAGKQPISAWLADAAERKLRSEGVGQAVRDWEKLHGGITKAEVRAAARKRPRARTR